VAEHCFGEDGKSGERFPNFGFWGSVCESYFARVAKGVGELTKVLPVLPVGRVVGKKRIGHMIRLNVPEGDNRYTPCPETCRTCGTLHKRQRRKEREAHP